MFCKYCGAAISDDSVFCPKCGSSIQGTVNESKVSVRATGTPVVAASDGLLERTALKIYLTDLRTLELSKKQLNERLNYIDNRIASLGRNNKNGYWSKPGFFDGWDETYYFFAVIGLGVGIFLIGLLLNAFANSGVGEGISDFFGNFSWPEFTTIGLVIMLIIAGIAILYTAVTFIKHINEQKKHNQQVDEHNRKDDQRVRAEIIEKSKLQEDRALMYAEYEKAYNLLQKAYDINVIPKQFRNIYAVFYLHEFITTSNEPLSNALLHFDLETIKRQLSVVISQQQQIILNQQIIMAQNEQIIKENQKQLKKLSALEDNTERAAQYAAIAANNTEACALLAAAHYIRTV